MVKKDRHLKQLSCGGLFRKRQFKCWVNLLSSEADTLLFRFESDNRGTRENSRSENQGG